jgi:hypothetical protein
MPKLKAPIVSLGKDIYMNSDGIEVSGNDFGEFHPTAQIRSISDLDKGGVFVGVGFKIPLTREQATEYISKTEKLRPEDRIKIDTEIMSNSEFANQIFQMCM